jgi:glyoxylase-like metal-dependent hydrolase (beta-lactamase superfamily II)
VLIQVAEGVLVHQSEFLQTNAVVVQGRAGVLLIDAGVRGDEMTCLANDLRESGQPVVAGFSTHPHWDHLLWHASLGTAPRYGTARCAATVRDRLSDAGAKARVAGMIPPDVVEQVPLDLLGLITGLPVDTARIPWDGPQVRIIEHQAHAPGHAALVIEERGVLIAADMLSDVLIPLLDLNGTADPIEDHLAALRQLEGAAGDVDVVVPGHGSVGGADQVHARIDQDRAYLLALGNADVLSDPRLGPSATFRDWLPGVHERQLQHLARNRARDAVAGHGLRLRRLRLRGVSRAIRSSSVLAPSGAGAGSRPPTSTAFVAAAPAPSRCASALRWSMASGGQVLRALGGRVNAKVFRACCARGPAPASEAILTAQPPSTSDRRPR